MSLHHKNPKIFPTINLLSQQYSLGIRIKPLLKIFNECRSLTGVGELNPY